MKFGYARVSKFEQNLGLQLDALIKEKIKAENIYTDKISRAPDKSRTSSSEKAGKGFRPTKRFVEKSGTNRNSCRGIS